MDFLNFFAAFQKVAVWPILTPIYYIFQGSSWKMYQPFNFVVLSPAPLSPSPASLDERDELALIPWDEQRHRETDWCESEECR